MIITPAGLQIVELTGLRLSDLADQIEAHFTVLATLADPEAEATVAERREGQQTLLRVLGWLWDAVAEPVLCALGHSAQPADGQSWSRIWWCPTGPLTLLPLHAAGHHTHPGDSVLDRVISSYTPTIGALLQAARMPTAAAGVIRMLAVAPNTPGLPALPGADRDVTALVAHPPASTEITALVGPGAARDDVRQALSQYRWVHLACHGEQDLAQPSRAALRLHDGPLSVLDIATQQLSIADGAYLAACDTAVGGAALTDEALHLAAALQYAGYRRVIAALWSVPDPVASRVTSEFYRRLSISGSFQPKLSAHAVHETTRQLRAARPHVPSVWAPYIHIGA